MIAYEGDRGWMDTASSSKGFPNPALIKFWVLISFFYSFAVVVFTQSVFKHFSAVDGQNIVILEYES